MKDETPEELVREVRRHQRALGLAIEKILKKLNGDSTIPVEAPGSSESEPPGQS